ncbi:hypothetical protein KAR48_17440 [bacterium]|nr:hypothetical protein [bacterium]
MCRQQYQAMSQIFTGAEQWHRLAPDQNMWYAIAKEIQPENKKHYRWQEIFDQILLPKPAWSITFCLIFGFIFGLFITGELSRISQQKPNMAINSTSQQSTPEDTFYTSSPVFSTQALYASFAGLEIK